MSSRGRHDMSRFEGKVVAVTGASLGIGSEISSRICEEGGRIVGVVRREGPARELAEALGEDRVSFVFGDVGDRETAGRALAACRELGGPDALINNAGLDHTNDLLTTPEQEVRSVFETNFFGALWMLQEFGGELKIRGRGSIVNVSSRLASIAVPTMGIYGASKGALEALTRAAAIELAPHGVRVNAVAPGLTQTDMLDEWISEQADPEGFRRMTAETIPQRRFGTAADVAAAVLFLASDEAGHITGVSLPVDGGYTAA
jgi:NAD(P)-dependent dehydrogenase (short-subunit alcohol dehydrogenase family)